MARFFSRKMDQSPTCERLLIDLTPAVIAETVNVLEASVLRAADAMHVAAAKIWEADLFISADRRQLAAARRCGLKIKSVS